MRIEEIRSGLANRLRERGSEIEQAILTRVHSVADPSERLDPEYTNGLRAAVSAALEYGIEAVERSEDRPAPIPTVLLSQARLAARHGIKLETVLRRYLAGYTLLGDFLIQESERGGTLNGASLKRLLRVQAAVLDRLIATVSEEYGREERGRLGNAEQRRFERIKRLLDGELLDTAELAYNFDGHHLGAIGAGPSAAEAVRFLAKVLGCHLLLIRRGEGTVWAWLGGRHPVDPEELERHVSQSWPAQVRLAIGEPTQGFAGWRLTHQQARAALPIALRSSQALIRYSNVALVASILQDDLLATSLRQLYLSPLTAERDGGKALRETLRAYFAAERNVSSTAAALRVNRQTVVNRLHTIEERFERPLNRCAAEVEAALCLEELGYSLSSYSAISQG